MPETGNNSTKQGKRERWRNILTRQGRNKTGVIVRDESWKMLRYPDYSVIYAVWRHLDYLFRPPVISCRQRWILVTRLQIYKGWFFVAVTGLLLCGTLIQTLIIFKKTERSLQDANEKLRALIQASPLAIITLDTEARVTSWNSAAQRMFGWSENTYCCHRRLFW